MSVNQKIQDLKIILPNAPTPVGAYSAFKKINNLIFISGQLPIDINGKLIKGKVGSDITLEQAQKASLLSCLNIIAQLKTACNGDLELVKNCRDEFAEKIFEDKEELEDEYYKHNLESLDRWYKELNAITKVVSSKSKRMFGI